MNEYNIYVYIIVNQLLTKGFKVKWGISKLALRGNETKAISQSASYTGQGVSHTSLIHTFNFIYKSRKEIEIFHDKVKNVIV